MRPPPLPQRHFPKPSSLPAFIRRLGYIVSLTLGVSAAVSLVWSTFLLPLLYSTFSARKAVTDQQISQLDTFIRSLTILRKSSIYHNPIPSQSSPSAEEGDTRTRDDVVIQNHGEKMEDSLLIEDIDIDPSLTPTPTTRFTSQPNTSPLSLLSKLTSLPTTLHSLSTHMDATTTTRTSLISTIQSFTSKLHTEIFISSRSNPSTFGGVGMHSLDDNLEKEGGGRKGVGKDEKWDEIRKEIRLIKGMLLSRRNLWSGV